MDAHVRAHTYVWTHVTYPHQPLLSVRHTHINSGMHAHTHTLHPSTLD